MTTELKRGAFAGLLLAAAALGGCGGSGSGGPELSAVGETHVATPFEQAMILGDQQRESGNLTEAIAAYRNAMELDPESREIYPRLGYAYIEAENYDTAVKVYERFVSVAPQDCEAHGGLAFAFLKQEDTDRAIAEYEKARDLCPDTASSHENLAKAYVYAKKTPEAIEAYRKAIELAPANVALKEQIAELYYKEKLFADAIAVYENILSDPANGKDDAWVNWANYRLAYMFNKAESWDSAARYYRAVATASGTVDPDVRNRSWLGLARALEEAKDYSAAIDAWEQVLAANPNRAPYYYKLGELLNDTGRYQEAIERVKTGQGLDESGCPAHGYCVVGVAYEKLGGLENYKRAEREFKKALACGDPDWDEYAKNQVERQKQLVKIEQLKRRKASQDRLD
ncbi:MAG: tetratricopeptide repeat protein [Gemmatimonadetes bacterium]|nr:tetratricopeptide repeat protein [Gemmatimonadota bacterium]